MSKKVSKYPSPSHHSRTKKGTHPNESKKSPIPGTGKNKPAIGYDPITKTWNQNR